MSMGPTKSTSSSGSNRLTRTTSSPTIGAPQKTAQTSSTSGTTPSTKPSGGSLASTKVTTASQQPPSSSTTATDPSNVGSQARTERGARKPGLGLHRTQSAPTLSTPTNPATTTAPLTSNLKASKAPPGALLQPYSSADKTSPTYTADRKKAMQEDTRYDGAIMGANGKAYSASTNWKDVEGIKPTNLPPGQGPRGKILYVNGQNTPAYSQAKAMQTLANQTGGEVVGIHTATRGGNARDGLSSIRDKLNGATAPRETLRHAVYDHLRDPKTRSQPLNIVGHSRGGIVVSNGLRAAKHDLMDDYMKNNPGKTRADAKQQVEGWMQNVHVQSAAGAAKRYPTGPQYRHIINKSDVVPGLFGGDSLSRKHVPGFSESGKRGQIVRFDQKQDAHAFTTQAPYLNPLGPNGAFT
jgi:hypothetical protein